MAGVADGTRDVDIDIGRLFAAVFRRWRAIALAVVASAVAALAIVLALDDHYAGEARILIETRERVRTDEAGERSDEAILDERGVTSQVEVIRSTDLVRQVIADLDLAAHREFAEAGGGGIVQGLLAMVGLAGADADTPVDQRVIEQFREQLSVFAVTQSRVIVVRFSSEDRELAAAVPNALADSYLEAQSGTKLADKTEATAWLEPEIADLRERVREAERKVAEYRARSGLLLVDESDTLATRELSDISTELSRIRSERADAEATAAGVRDALRNGSGSETLSDIVDSPLVQRLRENRAAIQARLAELSTTLLDGHPRMRALRSQLAELEERIEAEVRKVLASLENEASVARLREQQLVEAINALKANSAREGEEQVELRALEREAAAQRDLLETYLARYRDAAARAQPRALPPDARIIARAIVPIEPYFPKTGPTVIVAALSALLIAAIAVMLAELFSGRALRPAGAAGRERPDEAAPAGAGAAGAPTSIVAATPLAAAVSGPDTAERTPARGSAEPHRARADGGLGAAPDERRASLAALYGADRPDRARGDADGTPGLEPAWPAVRAGEPAWPAAAGAPLAAPANGQRDEDEGHDENVHGHGSEDGKREDGKREDDGADGAADAGGAPDDRVTTGEPTSGPDVLPVAAGGHAADAGARHAGEGEGEAGSENEDRHAFVDDAVDDDAADVYAAADEVAADELAADEAAADEAVEDFSIAGAAVRLIESHASLAVCVSPDGDEGSAATVMLARILAEEGMRVLLIDLTATGVPSRLMAPAQQLAGVTDLLAGDSAIAESIHADRLSPADMVPRGIADPARAAAAVERLPMVVEALREAYDMVIVECGATDAAGVARLTRAGDADVVVNVVELDEDAVTAALTDFFAAGYRDLIVMMPDAGGPPERPQASAA